MAATQSYACPVCNRVRKLPSNRAHWCPCVKGGTRMWKHDPVVDAQLGVIVQALPAALAGKAAK